MYMHVHVHVNVHVTCVVVVHVCTYTGRGGVQIDCGIAVRESAHRRAALSFADQIATIVIRTLPTRIERAVKSQPMPERVERDVEAAKDASAKGTQVPSGAPMLCVPRGPCASLC